MEVGNRPALRASESLKVSRHDRTGGDDCPVSNRSTPYGIRSFLRSADITSTSEWDLLRRASAPKGFLICGLRQWKRKH